MTSATLCNSFPTTGPVSETIEYDENRERMIPRDVEAYQCYRFFVGSNGWIDTARSPIHLRGGGVTQPLTPTQDRIILDELDSELRAQYLRIPSNTLFSLLGDFCSMPNGYHWFIDEFDPREGSLRRVTVVKDEEAPRGYRIMREDIPDASTREW